MQCVELGQEGTAVYHYCSWQRVFIRVYTLLTDNLNRARFYAIRPQILCYCEQLILAAFVSYHDSESQRDTSTNQEAGDLFITSARASADSLHCRSRLLSPAKILTLITVDLGPKRVDRVLCRISLRIQRRDSISTSDRSQFSMNILRCMRFSNVYGDFWPR